MSKKVNKMATLAEASAVVEVNRSGMSEPLDYMAEDDTDREYLLVSDTTSEVMKSSTSLSEMREMVELIRKAGGSATVFKAMNI